MTIRDKILSTSWNDQEEFEGTVQHGSVFFHEWKSLKSGQQFKCNSFIVLTLILHSCTCRTGKMKQMPWMKTWSCWLEQTQLSKNHCNQRWNLTQWKASKHGQLTRSLSKRKVSLQSIPLQPLVWHVSNPQSLVGNQILVSCTTGIFTTTPQDTLEDL